MARYAPVTSLLTQIFADDTVLITIPNDIDALGKQYQVLDNFGIASNNTPIQIAGSIGSDQTGQSITTPFGSALFTWNGTSYVQSSTTPVSPENGITFTDGATTVANATELTVTGGTIGGSTPNATLAISSSSLNGFTTVLNTAPPNDSINVSQLAATGGTSPQSIAVTVAQDGGAFSLALPTGDPTGGNVRGFAAVDLQTFPSGKNSATQVASGTYASIGGGGGNTASAFGAIVGGGIANSALGNNSIVAGGSFNSAENGSDTVSGGGSNVASGGESFVGGGANNQASGGVSVVVGGDGNTATNSYDTVAGGYNNHATGGYSFVGGGDGNNATGADSAVVGGELNLASGELSAVGGGLNNTTDGTGSWCPGGLGGVARGIYGRGSFGSGWILTPGDATFGVLPIRASTSDATPTVLTSTNTTPSPTNQLVLPDNSTFGFHGWILGRNVGTASSYWTFSGIIERGTGAGSVAIGGSGTITPTLISQDSGASTWAVAITADTANGGLAVTATGAMSTNITWNCRIETEELVD